MDFLENEAKLACTFWINVGNIDATNKYHLQKYQTQMLFNVAF